MYIETNKYKNIPSYFHSHFYATNHSHNITFTTANKIEMSPHGYSEPLLLLRIATKEPRIWDHW